MAEESEISGKTFMKDHFGYPTSTTSGNHKAVCKHCGIPFDGANQTTSPFKWHSQVSTCTGLDIYICMTHLHKNHTHRILSITNKCGDLVIYQCKSKIASVYVVACIKLCMGQDDSTLSSLSCNKDRNVPVQLPLFN